MVFPIFEQSSIAMCWHYLVSARVQAVWPDQQQTEDTTQSGHHGGAVTWHSHNIPILANILTDTKSLVTVSPPLLLPIFRLVGSVCVSETGAVLWCWGHWLELPLLTLNCCVMFGVAGLPCPWLLPRCTELSRCTLYTTTGEVRTLKLSTERDSGKLGFMLG